jgi:hypothetical protein
MYKFRLGLLAIAPLLMMTPALAQEVTLPEITGQVILTVTGLDTATYPDGSVELDIGRLEALGTTEIATSSIWTDGVHHYRGVPLRVLIDHLDITAENLRLHALNDYSVDFPTPEALPEAPILAFEMDGSPMSVREKGPIWVIYPFDDDEDYRTDTIFSRSIWQLDQIDVLR